MGTAWVRERAYLAAGILAMALLLVSMFFALQKPVSIEVDGKVIESRVFFTSTVADVLEKNNIVLGEKDRVEPSLDAPVKKNSRIVVNRAFKVKVTADGESVEIMTVPVSIKEAIELAGFKLGEKDIVKTLPTQKTIPNQEIEVIRVTQEEKTIEEVIPFRVETVSDNTLEKGLTKTLRQGKNGTSLNTVRITYHDGKEVKREVVNSETLLEPQNKIVAMGNITSVSRGGQNLNFREARYMIASAYTYTGYRTATGKIPAVGMVAVDPKVISLGTKLYVEGYGYAVAADTGGAIKGDRIDLFMEERTQCLNWGIRTVKVYILE